MGNNITFEDDIDDEDEDQLAFTEHQELMEEYLNLAVRSMMSNSLHTLERPTTQMPVIRKKPDLRTFRHTMMYKEIKALCALPPNSNRPNDRWSLTRGLLKRENGIVSRRAGTFTANQQRRVATLFVPNQKEERLMSLEAKVFICKFNKDGSKLITACQDSIIRIYDSSKGTYHRINRISAEDANWSILDIDFSPCGQYFVYSTWSGYFFVVPVDENNDEMQWHDLNIEQHRSGVFSVRFSPCGRTIIGGCTDSCVYMVDRETRVTSHIRTHQNNKLDVNAVSYVCDQDSNVFVTGCNRGIIKMWDVRCNGSSAVNNGDRNNSSSSSSSNSGSGSNSRISFSNRNAPVGAFMGHMDGITYIDPRNDGNYILTNSKDQSIKIWDLRMTTPTNKLYNVNLPFIDWDYRWHTVPRDYYNPKTTLDGDVSVMTYRGHRVTKTLLRAKFSPKIQTGQRYIYTGCSTGRIIIYDVLTGQIREAIEGHKDIVRDLSWHPVRSEIVSSSWDSHVNLNTFKRNTLIKRSSSAHGYKPLRRSRRIAHQNGELDDDDALDEPQQPW